MIEGARAERRGEKRDQRGTGRGGIGVRECVRDCVGWIVVGREAPPLLGRLAVLAGCAGWLLADSATGGPLWFLWRCYLVLSPCPFVEEEEDY